MMSERRFREMETQNRIACNLCGSNGASVRCDKCQSMAFCLSCDDMYHRHPKRRYHLRKAVALEMPKKYFENNLQNFNQMNLQNNSHISAHPSKMPVPPPRRKKKGLTLSSIKETFTSTGNKLRRFVSNEKLSIPPISANRYLNECRPNESPLIDKPMQTIRTQTLQNQRGVLPQNNSFGTLPTALPTIKRHNSFPAKLPEPQPIPPPLPPPRPKPVEMVYENYRKASLPEKNIKINKVSSSIGDLSKGVPPTCTVPEIKTNHGTFDRRNCSLHDLRANNFSEDDISHMSSQQYFPQFFPNQVCYGYPVHPWATSSLNNSIEDMNLNDAEDYDSDVSARQNMNRIKRTSMKRCNSAFQMYQGMGHPAMPPVPPFLYPYYYGHACSGHTSPLPHCSSPHPHLKTYNHNSRGSVDNMSTTSSSKDRSSKPKYIRKQKANPSEQFSDSGERSVTSSSRQQSDFDDDEEDFFSVSDNDTSDDISSQLTNGQWSCKFCTYLNDKKNSICEICSKTKKLKKTSDKSEGRINRKKKSTNITKTKTSDHFPNNNHKNESELGFDQKLINEQKEIEKELIRRLENERRIDRENEKIQRKEEYMRRKSLGLPVDEELIRKIRKDEEPDQNSSDIKSDLNNEYLKVIEKSIENKSTESQTNQQKSVELKTTQTMTDIRNEMHSNSSGEKCAKSVQCQFEETSFNDSNTKASDISNKTTDEQTLHNQNTKSVSTSQMSDTNGNNISQEGQQSSTQTAYSHHFDDHPPQCGPNLSASVTQSQQSNGFDGHRSHAGEQSHTQNMEKQTNGNFNQCAYQNQQDISSSSQRGPFSNSYDCPQHYNAEKPYNTSSNMNAPNNQTNAINNHFPNQNQQNMSTPMSPTGQPINNFDDRRPQYSGEQSYNHNNNINGQRNQNNGTANQFGYQTQQNISSQVTSTAQHNNHGFDDRRPYGPDSLYNQSSTQFQTPYNNYPMNPMMSPNLMAMNTMMSGFPMVPTMFSNNPLQNMYSSPFAQSLNGSQTGLDRFGYRSNSITSEQSFANPIQSQISSRYSSCENLHSVNHLNEKNQQKPQIESGLQLLHVLRDAEKNGFTSDDVEVALNFSPDKPIDWLEENWNTMCETVLTLTNNQIVQNVSKSGKKKLNELNLLNEEEAREVLRAAKGNIWQAIDRGVKLKQTNTSKAKTGSNGTVDDQNKGSFSLKISGAGSGTDNLDPFEDIDTSETSSENKQLIDDKGVDENILLTTVTVHTSEVQQIETTADRKTMERLLTDWKIEKLSSDRFRQQEKERQKMRKFMELQKKMSEFDSEDSEQDVEYHELVPDNQTSEKPEETLDQVLPEQLPDEISDDKWQVNTQFEFVDKNDEEDGVEEEVSDFEEYNSNTESDLSDEFDKIDARIQAKLKENFDLVIPQELPAIESINSEVVDDLVQKLGENSSNGNQRVNDFVNEFANDLVKDNVESQDQNEILEPIEMKVEPKQEISESEAKKIMKEIDRNVRRSLEELEQMELNVIEETKPIKQELPSNHMYDETFGWARTEYECELCCEIYSIEDLVAMISCTHYACRDCLQKYYGVQIRERQRLIISCPFCEQPDFDPDDDEKVFEYLGLLDQVIKYLVASDVYELFQRKLRDRALMRDENFLWCTQCSSGFISPNPQAKTIMCPDCKNLTCTLCKKKWKKQHFDITCEEFAEWEKANDPSYADQQLDKHLKEFGIECPNCKFRYQLAKGGCMHFRCIQCSYDFCGGCARPFKMGNRCGVSPYCEKLGLHAHHPRNCLFYLRDKDTDKLQSLLDKHKIQFKTKLDTDSKTARCPVMEQKHTSYGLKDEECNRYVESAGLCRLHYKEYLGDLIWKNGIDPIHIFNVEELELVLKRENIKLPAKNLSNSPAVREEYHKQLIELIIEKVPLNLHH